MTRKIEVSVSVYVNGHLVHPALGEFMELEEFATELLFPQTSAPVAKVEEAKPAKRHYGKREKRAKREPWSKVEEAFAVNRRLEGHSYKWIARELFKTYGIKRTDIAVAQRAYQLDKREKASVDEKPAEALPAPAAKPNEWGGTDGIKSPEVA